MGYYINPANETKEAFLEREGKQIGSPIFPGSSMEQTALVCLVDNGSFTAAGICYNEREMRDFNQAMDLRPKKWYLVAKDKLYAVSDITKEKFR